jgi:hypothetical protein
MGTGYTQTAKRLTRNPVNHDVENIWPTIDDIWGQNDEENAESKPARRQDQ